MIAAQALIIDAVHQGQTLATVSDVRRQVNELLRIAPEVIQPATAGQNGGDAAPGELGAVLQIGQQVGQFNIGFIQQDGGSILFFSGLHASLANRNIDLLHCNRALAMGGAFCKAEVQSEINFALSNCTW